VKKLFIYVSLISLLWLQPAAALSAEKAVNLNESVNEVYNLMDYYYVDELDEAKMTDQTIRAMVNALGDKYSQYLTEEQWEAFQSSIENNYVGIGVRIEAGAEGVTIVEIFEGSPAETAGLQAGDVFTKVNGKSVKDSSINELINQVIGPENSEVKVTVKRQGAEINTVMKRKKIQIPVLKKAYFDEGIGYLRLYSFSNTVDEQFADALQAMQAKGLDSLIIDLRGNGGGLLDSTLNIASLFVEDGVLIHTKIRGKQGVPVKITNGAAVNYPITILVDEGSASASEVFAGAMRDHGAASLIGTMSYGKGSVQQIFKLSNGGYLKLTIEEYLTPKMHPVNDVGLKPDTEVHSSAGQIIHALHQAGLKNMTVILDRGLLNVNGIKFEDTLVTLTEQDRLYVPVRFLAALVHADVKWDGQKKSILIKNSLNSLQLSLKSKDIKLIAGTSYMDASAFQAQFPQFTWHYDDEDILTFSVTKE
jgi:carboxyl-terminal processing protease